MTALLRLLLLAGVSTAAGIEPSVEERFFQELGGAAAFADQAREQRSVYRLVLDPAMGAACRNAAGRTGYNEVDAKILAARLELECSDLRGRDLRGRDFSGRNMSGSNLGRADLTGANLRGADLTGADMKEAVLKNADLRSAALAAAYLGDAVLAGADLSGAKFASGRHGEAYLAGADLSGAKLLKTDLGGAYMKDAVLRDAALREANLKGAHLAGADLRGADLTGAIAEFVYLKDAVYDGRTLLPFAERDASSMGMIRAEAPPGANGISTGLSAEQFHRVLDRVERVYAPLLRARKMRLVLWREWDNAALQAEAKVMEDAEGIDAVVQVSGGLARHPAMTEDSFTLVVCHELGHHAGGAPLMWGGRASEGQADYFAALKCMRRLHAADDNVRLMAGREVPERVKGLCRRSFARENDIALCERIALAGRQAGYFLADKRRVPSPSFDTPDPAVVEETFIKGSPAPQCRLDTYLAGAVCDADAGEDFSLDAPGPGACTPRGGFAAGARPRCWFAQSGGG